MCFAKTQMCAFMALKQFVERLRQDLGFEQALEANEDGTYSLRLEPDIDVTLKEDPDSIMFYTRLAELPSRNQEAFLTQAMIANLFGKETGGAALGLDNEGERVVLLDFIASGLTYKAFHEKLEDFVNYADAWRQETREFSKKQHEAEE